MRVVNKRTSVRRLRIKPLLLSLWLCIICCGICGCSTVVGYIPPEELPYDKLSRTYNHMILRTSSSLDVLNALRNPNPELKSKYIAVRLLSQSDTVIASSGTNKADDQSWFTMFAFDQHTMTANRKYFFCIDESATVSSAERKRYVFPPRPALIFDCKVILEPDVLDKPYATEEAKQIAVLRYIVEILQRDLQELMGGQDGFGQGNKILYISGMQAKQALEAALVEIEQSPVLASRLSDKDGIAFSHISLNNGRIRMTVGQEIATVKIRMGLSMN